ncbi:hypothetical protein AB0P17_15390 [Streptomyces sp. NPDC088124]|uniref:hypothetical protein n=1 Tax=Streptomyces sp. NPDC088124 TaxID=3154654 RepID=UPI003429AF61
MTPTAADVRRARILAGLAAGESYTTIADGLGVRTGTVGDWVYELTARVGVPDRAALVSYAYHVGWLALPDRPATTFPCPLPYLRRALVCIALGMTDRQTAARLGISLRTAQTYGERLRAHYGARHRAHAVALAHQHHHLPTNLTTRSSS